MPRNIEIKARVRDLDRQRRLIEAISDRPVELLEQEDTFFESGQPSAFSSQPDGEGAGHGFSGSQLTAHGSQLRGHRLKLRRFPSGVAELIHYSRPDVTTPKPSQYTIVRTPDGDEMLRALSMVFVPLGTVCKKRYLYFSGRTRIHLDDVENLGWFIELEVVLRDGESDEQGRAEADELMRRLQIETGDLLTSTYFEMRQSEE